MLHRNYGERPNITGKWYGILEGYSVSDPRRMLVISEAAGQLTCTWDEIGESVGAAAKCGLTNGISDLVTAANNNVRLIISDSTLSGTFTLTRNRGTFAIKMGRELTFSLSSTKLSESSQTIRYSIVSPGADVPPEFKIFSGVWVGKWRGELCGALIVEEVSRNGDVNVLYVWGHGSWISPGRERFKGTITRDGRLSLRKEGVFIDYRVVNPDELSGAYNNGTGTFKRR